MKTDATLDRIFKNKVCNAEEMEMLLFWASNVGIVVDERSVFGIIIAKRLLNRAITLKEYDKVKDLPYAAYRDAGGYAAFVDNDASATIAYAIMMLAYRYSILVSRSGDYDVAWNNEPVSWSRLESFCRNYDSESVVKHDMASV